MTRRTRKTALGIILIGFLSFTGSAALGQPFVGEIMCGGWTFCPVGWAHCSGNLEPIAENLALFQLIGTTYGGDGVETYALPNIAGRTVIGQGQGTGLTSRTLGQSGGAETVTLTQNQMPSHTHTIHAQAGSAGSASPVSKYPAQAPAGDAVYSSAATTTLAASAVGSKGGSQPHNNLQPYLAVRCCISLYGVMP